MIVAEIRRDLASDTCRRCVLVDYREIIPVDRDIVKTHVPRRPRCAVRTSVNAIVTTFWLQSGLVMEHGYPVCYTPTEGVWL